jgi:hypothetical protein
MKALSPGVWLLQMKRVGIVTVDSPRGEIGAI